MGLRNEFPGWGWAGKSFYSLNVSNYETRCPAYAGPLMATIIEDYMPGGQRLRNCAIQSALID
jgi:hypothetical protein